MPTTYDTEFDDFLSFDHTSVSHETHVYLEDDSISFDDSDGYHSLDKLSRWNDSYDFGESYTLGNFDAQRTLSDSISFVPVFSPRIPISRSFSNSFHFLEAWFVDNSAETGAFAQAFTFVELFSADKVIAPDRRLFDESITFGESWTAIKLKIFSDFVQFNDSWCISFDIKRVRSDSISFNGSFRRYLGDNPFDPRNTPTTISDGSGFILKGNYKKSRYETINFEEHFGVVDKTGTEIIVDPCKVYILLPDQAEITSIQVIDGETVWINFDLPVTIDTGVVPDSNLTIGSGGNPPTAVTQLAPTTIQAVNTASGWGVLPGDPWNLNTQPNWIITLVDPSQSGTLI